jgi:ribosomal protein S18 acetylase RimI-like enzyme
VGRDPSLSRGGQARWLVRRRRARPARSDLRPAWPAEIRREREALFARIAPAHRFALARADGRPAASGLCVADGELAGVFSMRTQPGFRRRGLAESVLLRLAGWARSLGARRVYLQVKDDNAGALRLYRRFGFAKVYGYHYRERGLS